MKRIAIKSLIILAVIIAAGCTQEQINNDFTGLVEGRTYALASPVSDKLISLSISEGDTITSGQNVGQIDTASLTLQLRALEAKQAQLDLQRQELNLNTAQVRDTRDYYRSNYEKNLELLKVQAVSDQTVRDLKLNADKWERDLQSLLIKEESLKRQKEEIGYQIQNLELTIHKGTLTSPAAGYVDKVFYETGEYVPALRPVAQIVSLSNVWCYIYVGEEILAEISPGQKMEAVFQKKTFPAKVEHINSRAEFTPKEVLTPDNRAALVYAVRIGIENPDGVLKIGMPVEIRW